MNRTAESLSTPSDTTTEARSFKLNSVTVDVAPNVSLRVTVGTVIEIVDGLGARWLDRGAAVRLYPDHAAALERAYRQIPAYVGPGAFRHSD